MEMYAYYSVRTVHIEWLSFGVCACAGSWVSKMAHPHVSGQIYSSGTICKDLCGHSIAFTLVDLTTRSAGRDPAGILAPMLQDFVAC